MATDTPPHYKAASFTCPHCKAHCQQSWAHCTAEDSATGDYYDPGVYIATCFGCHQPSFWLGKHTLRGGRVVSYGEMIHPRLDLAGPARSTDMPPYVAALYDEAGSVLSLSPRSASALLRLALEVLLEGLYPDEAGNLNKMIGAAVADGLPIRVQRTMDVMRFSGNQSVHKFHHDDTPATAATLFSLLNLVVENLITQPKQLDELYEGLPDGFKEQVKRRDGANE